MTREYMNNKFVESLIYDTKIQLSRTSTEKKLNIEFLKKLNDYLKQEQIKKRIDTNIKERTYKIMDYIRFDMKKNKDIHYNKEINEAIRNLNQIKDQICISFYYNQLNARVHYSKKITEQEKIDNLSRLYNKICYSISCDYRVLYNLKKESKDYVEILPKYIGDEWFLSSIKGIYYENAEIFDEEIIQENLYLTIMKNENLHRLDNTLRESNQQIKEIILKR